MAQVVGAYRALFHAALYMGNPYSITRFVLENLYRMVEIKKITLANWGRVKTVCVLHQDGREQTRYYDVEVNNKDDIEAKRQIHRLKNAAGTHVFWHQIGATCLAEDVEKSLKNPRIPKMRGSGHD